MENNGRTVLFNTKGKLETTDIVFANSPLNLIVADVNGQAVNINYLDKIKLNQVYPNPFNPITELSYSIFQDSYIELMVYDINGRQIETLINEFQSIGNYKIQWNAEDKPSGAYFIKFTADGFIQTQRVMLVK